MKKLLELLQRIVALLEKLSAGAGETKGEPIASGAEPSTDTSSPAPAPTPPPEPEAPGTPDDLDLATVEKDARFKSAKRTATISEAWTEGSAMHTRYSYSGWPTKEVGGATCDATCHFYYKQGDKVAGGKFDWWRKGGQQNKTLENVHGGYGGHSMPAKGTPCWTMIVSVDGKQRSNVKAVQWR